MKLLNVGVSAITVACTPMIASAQLAVTRVVTQGDVVTYGAQNITIGLLNAPFTNSLGKVGFTGGATPGGSFVWYDTGITWLNTDDVVNTVSGAEGTMGVSDTGGFIYSPSVNTFDAVYTNNGPLLKDGDALPAIPGQFSAFNSRPVMIPGGTAYWIGGYSATSGGATAGRVFLKCTNTADVNTITKILQTGDLIGGLAINSTGLGFGYDVSDNGSNYIIAALVGAATATDDRVLVNGAAVAAAGTSTGSGDNWSAASGFADMSINNSGNYVFTGDTDAATADEAMVYNGAVVLREGAVIGGVTLGGACNAASINNLGKIAFIWSATSVTTEALFYGNAATPACAKVILKVGDALDTNGDLNSDAIVTDLEASGTIGPGLSLSDDDFIFVEVSTTPVAGGAETETIIKIPVNVCRADTDGNGEVNVTDLLAVIGTWGPCSGCNSDTNDDCQVNVTDLLAVIGAWGFCD